VLPHINGGNNRERGKLANVMLVNPIQMNPMNERIVIGNGPTGSPRDHNLESVAQALRVAELSREAFLEPTFRQRLGAAFQIAEVKLMEAHSVEFKAEAPPQVLHHNRVGVAA